MPVSAAGTFVAGASGAPPSMITSAEPGRGPSRTVSPHGVVGDPPAGSGGTVLDGTYDMIEARLYVGAAGAPGITGNRFQATLRITGGTTERAVIFTSNAGGTTRSFVSGTLTVSGPNATYAIACPNPTQESLAISVLSSGTSLTLTNQVTKEAFVWSKRP